MPNSFQPGRSYPSSSLEYQGNGYGILLVPEGLKFEVRSSRSFTSLEGKTITLRVVGYEQGGPTTPLEERPAVRYIEENPSRRRIDREQAVGGDEVMRARSSTARHWSTALLLLLCSPRAASAKLSANEACNLAGIELSGVERKLPAALAAGAKVLPTLRPPSR